VGEQLPGAEVAGDADQPPPLREQSAQRREGGEVYVAGEARGVEARDATEIDAEPREVAGVPGEQAPGVGRSECAAVGDAQVAAGSASAAPRAQLVREAQGGESRPGAVGDRIGEARRHALECPGDEVERPRGRALGQRGAGRHAARLARGSRGGGAARRRRVRGG
jgi:hypothetical protein